MKKFYIPLVIFVVVLASGWIVFSILKQDAPQDPKASFHFTAPAENEDLILSEDYEIRWADDAANAPNAMSLVVMSEECLQENCWKFGQPPLYGSPDFILLQEYVEGDALIWIVGEYKKRNWDGPPEYLPFLAEPGAYRLLAFRSSETGLQENLLLGSVDFQVAAKEQLSAEQVGGNPAPVPTNISSAPAPVVTKASQEVVDAIELQGSARVIVTIQGNGFNSPDFHDDTKKKEEVRRLQNNILENLTPADWTTSTLFSYIPSFAGTLTRSGLDKLNFDSRVISIQLDEAVGF